eukprot:TRINITY_DN685_c0_g1_i1.p1 TRINITY_DN685_c0_g1~~TRINITY_DN685_c0_g1_i1.p1  ORF type:complete len:4818 (-),score=1112.10 TRINITY_DN685_c0_g1_i1:287-14740(-)
MPKQASSGNVSGSSSAGVGANASAGGSSSNLATAAAAAAAGSQASASFSSSNLTAQQKVPRLQSQGSLDNVLQPGEDVPLVSKRRPVILERSNSTPPEELVGVITQGAPQSRASRSGSASGSPSMSAATVSSSPASASQPVSGVVAQQDEAESQRPGLRRAASEPIHKLHSATVTKAQDTTEQASQQTVEQSAQAASSQQTEIAPETVEAQASGSGSGAGAGPSGSAQAQQPGTATATAATAAAILQRLAANREAVAVAEPLPTRSVETAFTRAQVTKAAHTQGAARKPLEKVKTITPPDSAALLAELLRSSTEDVQRDLNYRRDQSRALSLENPGRESETVWIWIHVAQHSNCYIRPYIAASYMDTNHYATIHLAMEVPDVPNLFVFPIRSYNWEVRAEQAVSVMLVDELTNFLLMSTYSGIPVNQTCLFVNMNAPESGVSENDCKASAKNAFTIGMSMHLCGKIRFATQAKPLTPVVRVPPMTVQQYMPCFDILKTGSLSPAPSTLGDVLGIFLEFHKAPVFCEIMTCWLLLIYNHRYFGAESVIPQRATDHSVTIAFAPYIQTLERALRNRQGLMAPLRIVMTSLFYLLMDIIYRSNDDFVYPICFFNNLFNQLPGIQIKDIEKIECKYDEVQAIRTPETFREIAQNLFTILRRMDCQYYIFRPFSVGEYVSKLLSLEDRAIVLKKVVEELQVERFRSRLDPTESAAMIYFRMRDDLVDGINRTLLKEFKQDDLRRLVSLLKEGHWSMISIDACQSILEGLTSDEQYLRAIFELLQKDRFLINDRLIQHMLWNGLVCRWPDMLKWLDLLFYTRYFRDYKKLLEESLLRSFKARDKEIFEDFGKALVSLKEFYTLFSNVDAQKAFEGAFVSFLALYRVERTTKAIFDATGEFKTLPESLRDAILGHLSSRFCDEPKLDSILFLVQLDNVTNVIVDRLLFDLVNAIRIPREFPNFLKDHVYWHTLYVKLQESKEKLLSKLKSIFAIVNHLVSTFQESIQTKSALFSLLEDTTNYREQILETYGQGFLDLYAALYVEMEKMALIFKQLKEFNQHFLYSLGNMKVYEALEGLYSTIERSWGGLNLESSKSRLPLPTLWQHLPIFSDFCGNQLAKNIWAIYAQSIQETPQSITKFIQPNLDQLTELLRVHYVEPTIQLFAEFHRQVSSQEIDVVVFRKFAELGTVESKTMEKDVRSLEKTLRSRNVSRAMEIDSQDIFRYGTYERVVSILPPMLNFLQSLKYEIPASEQNEIHLVRKAFNAAQEIEVKPSPTKPATASILDPRSSMTLKQLQGSWHRLFNNFTELETSLAQLFKLSETPLLSFLEGLNGGNWEGISTLFEMSAVRCRTDIQHRLVRDLRSCWQIFFPILTWKRQGSTSLREFVESLSDIQANKPTLDAVRQVSDNLENIQAILDTALTTPASQAITDMEAIMKGYQFEIEMGKKGVSLTATHISEHDAKPFPYLELDTLRSRISLMLSLGRDLSESKVESMKQLVDFIVEIFKHYRMIVDFQASGHPDYQEGILRFNAPFEAEKIAELTKNETQKFADLENVVKSLRKDHYVINYFTTKQLFAIMNTGFPSRVPEGGAFYRFIQRVLPHKTLEQVKEQTARAVSASTTQADTFTERVVKSIECLEKFKELVGDIAPDDLELGDRPLDWAALRRNEPNILLAPDVKTVSMICLSIYYGLLSRAPRTDEILDCSTSTTLEQVQIFLYRCFQRHSERHCVYALLEPENLSLDIQQSVVQFCKNEMPGTFTSYLIFITKEKEKQPILASFSKCKRNMPRSAYDEDTLRKSSSMLLKKDGIDLSILSSQGSGMGKTFLAKKKYAELNLPFESIQINGSITAAYLIEELTKRLSYKTPIIYFNLGTTTIQDVGKIFFSLLILRSLEDSEGHVFHLDKSCDILIEVPNMNHGLVHQAMHFLALLPITDVNLPLDVSLQNPDLVTATKQGHLQNMIQYVCKTIEAFKKDEIRSTLFDPRIVPDLSVERCQAILDEYCPQDRPFQVNFVKFCFYQMQLFEASEYLAPNKLMGYTKLRSEIIKVLLRSSVDFSVSCFDRNLFMTGTYTEANMYDNFQLKRTWNDSKHPLVLLNHKGAGSFRVLVPHDDEFFKSIVKTLDDLKQKPLDLNKVVKEQAYEELSILFGESVDKIRKTAEQPGNEFIITRDNLLKLVSVFFRIKAGLPIIIMGETGCGKTRLIKFLCDIMEGRSFTLDVHGGIKENDVKEIVQQVRDAANENPNQQIYLFFDEINTANCMGLFKECLCDRSCDGIPFPPNVAIIGACNPYRFRVDTGNRAVSGLIFKYNSPQNALFKDDLLDRLVYLVYPIPPSMAMHVWDFGSLSNDDEKEYVSSIVRNPTLSAENHTLFTEMIVKAQDFLRKIYQDDSCVSLRDVHRCASLQKWFFNQDTDRIKFYQDAGVKEADRHDSQLTSIILALSCCYYYRLGDKNRTAFVATIAECGKPKPDPKGLRSFKRKEVLKFTAESYLRVLEQEQQCYMRNLVLPANTSRNFALTENLFLMIVSIFRLMPSLIVGKPGSSKSFSIQVLKSNFNVEKKKTGFFTKFPSLVFYTYQCSPLSTPTGILDVYKRAHHGLAENILPVVLLDEVGLAEQSPELPLKVLHWVLDKPKVAVVGISNWELDAAKANRMLVLNRPDPSIQDLHKTAIEILGFNPKSHTKKIETLEKISIAYKTVYNDFQPSVWGGETSKGGELAKKAKEDYYGLRDFYNFVKFLERQNQDVDPVSVSEAICRNLNGDKVSRLLEKFEVFKREMGVTDLQRIPVVDLVFKNLTDPHARHLMVVTDNNYGLQYLLDEKKLSHDNTRIFYATDYPDNHDDHYISKVMFNIRECMEAGKCVVLVKQQNIYESLYDVLNQHYVVLNRRKYCYLPIGAQSEELYAVDDRFKCIVIANQQEVYSLPPDGLPPPFLNRFEKQLLTFSDLLTPELDAVCTRLRDWVSKNVRSGFWSPESAFAGFHENIFQSLVLCANTVAVVSEDVFNVAMRLLLWVAKPEWALNLKNEVEIANIPVRDIYFEKQSHQNLVDLMTFFQDQGLEKCFPHAKSSGLHISVWTHAIGTGLDVTKQTLERKFRWVVDVLDLGCILTESALNAALASFFSKPEESYLLVGFQSSYCSLERLDHFKFTYLEKQLNCHNPSKKHIILINYIPRRSGRAERQAAGSAEGRDAKKMDAATVFDRTWTHVYLDTLLPGYIDGIPELSALVQKTVSQAISDASIMNFDVLVEKEYARAMPLSATQMGTHLTEQIQLFGDLFRRGGDDAFRAKFLHRLMTALKNKTSTFLGSSLWSPTNQQDVKLLEREGCLRNAMFEKLREAFYTELSNVLDISCYGRNLLLLKYDEHPTLKHSAHEIWLSFLSYDPIWRLESGTAKGQVALGVTKRLLQVGSKLSFPFSTFIAASIENYYGEVGSVMDSSKRMNQVIVSLEGICRSSFPFLYAIHADELDPFTNLYLIDYVRSLDFLGIHKEEERRSAIADILLEFFGTALQLLKCIRYVHTVHVIFWYHQTFLREINQVFSFVSIDVLQNILQTISSEPSDSMLDLQVRIMLTLLNDQSVLSSHSHAMFEKIGKIVSILNLEKKRIEGEEISLGGDDTGIVTLTVKYHLLKLSQILSSNITTQSAHIPIEEFVGTLKISVTDPSHFQSFEIWEDLVQFIGRLLTGHTVPSIMIERALLDFILHVSLNTNPSDEFLVDEISRIVFDAGSRLARNGVSLSESSRTSILDKIFHLEGSGWADSQWRAKAKGMLSTITNISCSLTAMYTETYQDFISELYMEDPKVVLDYVKENPISLSSPIIDTLENIAFRKLMYDNLASDIVTEFREHQGISPESITNFGLSLSGIEGPYFSPLVKYFIKKLYSKGGFHLSRTIVLLLLQKYNVLSNSDMVRTLAQQSASDVPVAIPFSHLAHSRTSVDEHHKFYSKLVDVLEYSMSGSTGNFPQYTSDELCSIAFKRAFVLAIYDRVFLRYGSLDETALKFTTEEIDKYIMDLPWPEYQKKLVLMITQNNFPVQEVKMKPNLAHFSAYLSAALVHMIATIVCLPDAATPFAKLITDPDSVMDTYWITMADDPRKKEAQKLMQTGYGVYVSPNGCLYNVWNCTWPYEVVRCQECGNEDTGGTGHIPLPGHRRVVKDGDTTPFPYKAERAFVSDLTERAPKGYEVPFSIISSKTYTEKGLNPIAFRVLRFILNTVLFLSSTFKPLNIRGASLPETLFKHLTSDWEVLREITKKSDEDVAILIHMTVRHIGGDTSENYSSLVTYKLREKFEGHILKSSLNRFSKDPNEAIFEGRIVINLVQKMNEHFCQDMEDKLSLEEVRGAEFIKESLPLIFRVRSSVMDLFINQYSKSPPPSSQFPALSALLDCEEHAMSLRYLPSIIGWMKALYNIFDKRLTREEARAKTMSDALALLSGENTAKTYASMFKDFCTGWNIIRGVVEEILRKENGNISVPEMNENTPLVFGLTNSASEGRIPMELIKTVVSLQNEILHKVLHPKTQEQAEQTDTELDPMTGQIKIDRASWSIDLEQISGTEVIDLNYHNDPKLHQTLTALVRKYSDLSYQYGRGTSLLFDYALLNQELFVVNFDNKPFVGKDERSVPCLPAFRFANEAHISDTIDIVASKIPQSALTPELTNYLGAEGLQRNIPEAQRLMRTLEYCLNWLRLTGGDPSASLIQYLQTNLMESSAPKCFERFRLCHVQGLFHYLSTIANSSLENRVAPAYKLKLSTAQRQAISEYLQTIPPDCVAELHAFMSEFVSDYLDADSYEPSHELNIYLGSSLDFIETRFPFPDISLAYALDSLLLIEAYMEQHAA